MTLINQVDQEKIIIGFSQRRNAEENGDFFPVILDKYGDIHYLVSFRCLGSNRLIFISTFFAHITVGLSNSSYARYIIEKGRTQPIQQNLLPYIFQTGFLQKNIQFKTPQSLLKSILTLINMFPLIFPRGLGWNLLNPREIVT